jgi:hypothetical protein
LDASLSESKGGLAQKIFIEINKVSSEEVRKLGRSKSIHQRFYDLQTINNADLARFSFLRSSIISRGHDHISWIINDCVFILLR